MRNILFIGLLFQVGCSGLKIQKNQKENVLSCEQKAEPKSLQYLEQQYRCSSSQ